MCRWGNLTVSNCAPVRCSCRGRRGCVGLACPLAATMRHIPPRGQRCPRSDWQPSTGREVPSWSHQRSSLLLPHLPRADNSLSQGSLLSWFPETPQRLRAPSRLPWRPLIHSSPLPLHFVLSRAGRPDQRPPRREPAGAGGRGPMNSRDPGTLAVDRVKFFGRHRGEVRPCRSLPRS